MSVVFAFGLVIVMQGCAGIFSGTPPQTMIEQKDHAGLANFYKQQAQELREKAKTWETWAEFYDRHQAPHGKTVPIQHAAHCRVIAQSYLKAAEEAESLAIEHRHMLTHGMVN